MKNIATPPLLVFAFSFVALWFSALVGALSRKRLGPRKEDQRGDFRALNAATLTVLGVLIGFTFSMALGRYELRKSYEEEEANAISTEYLRADLLPAADGARVRDLLRDYLDQRVLFYTTRNVQQLRRIDANTTQLQNDLWSRVQVPAATQPTPMVALAVAGMHDVLNSQGNTRAAWLNRIPFAAWVLLAVIAVCCNLLLGYSASRMSMLLMVLPLVASVSFFLIADIDSPRAGLIRVRPQNLASLSQSLHTH
ncbi:MAG TPA: hypothetical protein VKR57_13715 [Terriglobales bacterium]|jgi:hypothetical protein|nr:hypothetical protein [Terriglobales bacterium]